jgi:protein-S-isoprenylcysteine O-methyltransferase Ste14
MLAERAQVREGAKAWDRFLAAAIVVVARRELSHHGQPTDPGFPTSHVVPTGVFFVSRNPIYLGAACLLIGIALAVNLPWVFVLLLPALVGCHYIPIAPEERHLAVKLGEEYLTYAVSVHPWVGRARRPR